MDSYVSSTDPSNLHTGMDVVLTKRNLWTDGTLWLVGTVLLFWGLGSRGLWAAEGRWAQVTQEMFQTGDFFHPTISGEPYFDTRAFLESSPGELKTLTFEYNGNISTPSEIIDDICQVRGVNPKLVLALIELHTGGITGRWPRCCRHRRRPPRREPASRFEDMRRRPWRRAGRCWS